MLGHAEGGREGGRGAAGSRLNAAPAAPQDVASFLAQFPPFDGLDWDAVQRVGAAAEVERHRAGTAKYEKDEETRK